MRRPHVLIAAALLALLALACLAPQAHAGTSTFTNSDGIHIEPYGSPPSTIDVSGLHGVISKVTVGINGYSQEQPAAVSLYLRSPAGQEIKLDEGCGFFGSPTGVGLIFDDAASTYLPEYETIASGTYKPTICFNYEADSLASAAPNGPNSSSPNSPALHGNALSTFNGADPNGKWELIVGNDYWAIGSIRSWNLTISTDDKPTATDDSYTTPRSTALSKDAAVGVLANDTNPAGGSLTAALDIGPAHGTLVLNADGSFSYTPITGYVGPDSFTYHADNGAGRSESATVTIIVGTGPLAKDGTLSTDEDTPANGTLKATDGDGGALTYSVVAQPAHGSVTITDAATGAYTYTPAANYNGPDSLTFKANDGDVDSNIATVNITVAAVNDAPVIGVPGAQITPLNTKLVFAASSDNGITLSDDMEVESTQIRFTFTVKHGIIGTPLHGRLGSRGEYDFRFDAAREILSKLYFIPDGDYTGPASITITVNDLGNSGNGGPKSDTKTINITVQKGDQTISFGNPGTHTYGDAPITLSATASSRLPVTYTIVSGPASVSGDVLTLTGAGDVTVRASQPGNDTYNAAPDVEQTFAVEKASLTISADDKTRYVGTANPPLTVSYSPFVGADDESSLDTPVQLVTSADENSPAGEYDIDLVGGSGAHDTAILPESGLQDNNYSITFVKGKLSVTAKRVALITWPDPDTITYGTALGATQLNATATYNGEAVPGTFSYTPAAGTTLGAGRTQSLHVEFTPKDPGTYAILSDDAQIDVAPAPLTFTIGNKSMVYGDAPPQFTATPDGFVNGEDEDDLLFPPLLYSHVPQDGSVGSYEIDGIIFGANYAITIKPGTLTITPAPLTIIADDKVRYFKAPNPELTASFNGLVNGDRADDLDRPVHLTTDANADSPVGEYDIELDNGGVSDANYTITFVEGTLKVTKKRVPTITWSDPAPITYGMALGDAQLKATVTFGGQAIPGTFSYTPAAGTVLHAGNEQSLQVAFTPEDGDAYESVETSVDLDVLPAPLTITIADKAKVYGAAVPQLTASYSAFANGENEANLDTGLVLTTSGSASSDVGSYPIKGTAFDSDYDITIKNGTLTVTPAPLTIWGGYSYRRVGAPNPQFMAWYDGFVNGDSEEDLDVPVSLTTTATQSSPEGAYDIVASGAADSNYTITFQNGTLFVFAKEVPLVIWRTPPVLTYGTPLSEEQLNAFAFGMIHPDAALRAAHNIGVNATPRLIGFGMPGSFTYSPAVGTVLDAGTHTLSVTFTPVDSLNFATVTKQVQITVNKKALGIALDNASKVYGAALPQFTAIYTGFANGDDASDLDAPLSFDTAATPASDVGSYPLVGSAFDPNYTITITNSTLAVTPAPLTISADSKIRKLNTPNPDLTASYAGFVNGDNASSLDVPVSLATAATQASPLGDYDIIASGAADDNYAITFAKGTLTVTDKEIPALSWANPAGITYGTALGNTQLNATAHDGAAAVPGTFTYTPAAGTVLHAGIHTLSVTFTPTDGATYAPVTTQVVLDVRKAALTIAPDDKTMQQGGSVPALTASYAGFVNGDTLAALDAPVRLATTATAASPVGTYPITAGDASDSDYAIAFANGTLTVSPKPATMYRIFIPLVVK